MIYIYAKPKQGADGGPHYFGPQGLNEALGFSTLAEACRTVDEQEAISGEFWIYRIADVGYVPDDIHARMIRLHAGL